MPRLICHIIGNRPHFMKLAPVYQAFNVFPCQQVIIHTGQHYDHNLSEAFIKEFDLPSPDITLTPSLKNSSEFIGSTITQLSQILSNEKPDLVIVYGDTNSTLAGAVASKHLGILTAHVEAGLREFDLSIPEEINKRAIDGICDILFAPSETAFKQLKSEHVLGSAYFVGDVTFDHLKNYMPEVSLRSESLLAKHQLRANRYFLVTCHRQKNTENSVALENIIESLKAASYPCVFLLHPRTKQALERFDISLSSDNIKVLAPQSYLDTQILLNQCYACITDSGGLIKEAFFHQKRAIIIDEQTEWKEVVDSGQHLITGPNTTAIIEAMKTPLPTTFVGSFYGNGNASNLIVKHCLEAIQKSS